METKRDYEEPSVEMWEMDICNVVSASGVDSGEEDGGFSPIIP